MKRSFAVAIICAIGFLGGACGSKEAPVDAQKNETVATPREKAMEKLKEIKRNAKDAPASADKQGAAQTEDAK
ncbi:MAG: hypothetical protein HZB26_23945 [Candidatus Hydrogenedentes bacterium]|nr:hypothetical protein [Candidatus Hydrogenedentota bacterium]